MGYRLDHEAGWVGVAVVNKADQMEGLRLTHRPVEVIYRVASSLVYSAVPQPARRHIRY